MPPSMLGRALCFTQSTPFQCKPHPETPSQTHPEGMFNLGPRGNQVNTKLTPTQAQEVGTPSFFILMVEKTEVQGLLVWVSPQGDPETVSKCN